MSKIYLSILTMMILVGLNLSACQPIQAVQPTDSAALTSKQGIAEINGAQLSYEVKGVGEPVVLIHGFSLDKRLWDDHFNALAASYQVIRYDWRGHGQSSGITAPFKPEEELSALLNFLHIDKVHLVGYSMGGAIATTFALAYPTRVKSLVLIDALVPDAPVTSELLPRLVGYIDTATATGLTDGLQQWLTDPLFAPASAKPALRTRLAEMVMQGQTRLAEGAAFMNLQNIQLDGPIHARLAEINVPTLVMVGAKDLQEFQTMAADLSQGLKNAQSLVIDGAGHLSPMEKPAQVTKALQDFLSEVAVAP